MTVTTACPHCRRQIGVYAHRDEPHLVHHRAAATGRTCPGSNKRAAPRGGEAARVLMARLTLAAKPCPPTHTRVCSWEELEALELTEDGHRTAATVLGTYGQADVPRDWLPARCPTCGDVVPVESGPEDTPLVSYHHTAAGPCAGIAAVPVRRIP